MLAISSWTWVVVAALGLVTVGVLIRATLGLIARLKELNKTLAGASGDLREALEVMRSDLDETNENLAELRRRQEPDAT
jgi:phage shock protein A